MRFLIFAALIFTRIVDASLFESDRLLISGSYLLMRLEQDGISYGNKISVGPVPITTPGELYKAEQEVLFFPFDFKSGLRIVLGWEERCSCWGIKGSYDYLFSSASALQKSIAGKTPNQEMVGTNLHPAFGNWINIPSITYSDQSLEASWKADFNQVDLYLDRKFESFRRLGFNLLLGIRLASIDQKIRSDFKISGTTPLTIPGLFQAASQIDNLETEFKGAGVMSGFEIHGQLAPELNLFGFLKGAFLYSNSKFHLQATESQDFNGSYSQLFHTKEDHTCGLKTALDLGLGLEYSTCVANGLLICLHTSWEHHLWYNQNFFYSAFFNPQISDQSDKPFGGDFSYYGWTFGLDVIF